MGDIIMHKKLKTTLKLGHRYLGLLLAPILMVILVSGAVLAFKPILAPEVGVGIHPSISVAQVKITLQKADPDNQMSQLSVLKNGTQIWLQGGKRGPEGGVYDLRSGEYVGSAGMGLQTYSWFKNMHKKLFIDAGWLVELVSYALAGMLLVGAWLLRPRFKRTLMDTHNTLGWLALPLWLVLPVTGVMMCLHLGAPNFGTLETIQYPLEQVIESVGAQGQLGQLASIESIKGRYQMVKLAGETYQLNEQMQLQAVSFNRYWAKELHEGTWAGAFSGGLNLVGSLGLMVLTGTGVYSWWRRQRQSRQKQIRQDETILVAFASQTGTAAALAKQTAIALREAGQGVVCNPLSSVHPEELNGYEQVLLIVSTTGEGEVPEQANAFMAALPQSDLANTQYALLALGDSRYPYFCQAGKDIEMQLKAQGAKPLQLTVYADGTPDEVWCAWLAQIGSSLGLTLNTTMDRAQDQPVSLTLINKERLDQNESTGQREVWQLDFKAPASSTFRPGDLLLVTPHGADCPRVYSIGSSHLVGQVLRLTVGLAQFEDEQGQVGYGVCSHYLCRELTVGTSIQGLVRVHEDFHPPQDAQKKVILVATGTGIAPFPGFLMERAQQQSQACTWLFFGNRCQQKDYFYAEQLQEWRTQGVLADLTTAFSVDDGEYIQHKLVAEGTKLYEWLQQGAVVYVCGRANTVGQGVMNALQRIYQNETGAGEVEAAKWLSDLQAKQRIKMDLFG